MHLIKSVTLTICFLFVVGFLYATTCIKIACVGNSVTYGYLLNNPLTESYPAQLQQLLGKNYEVGNFGHNGATLLVNGHRPYIAQEAYQKALNFKPDMVIFHLGLNDTDPRNYPNYGHLFTQDYINLVRSFQKVNPNVKVFIAKMSPITAEHARFLAGTRDWYRAIQHKIALVAQYVGAQLIDFNEPLITRPNLLPDAVHPTKQGATLLAQTAFKAITGNYGGLKLPAIYANNMVIDADKPFVVAGMANAGELVHIVFDTEAITQKASNNGRWKAEFRVPRHKQNLTLKVNTAQKKLLIQGIKVGKVWLCSGQSNMAFPLKEDIRFREAMHTPVDSNLCFFEMTPKYDTNNTEWSPEALDTVNNLTYFSTKGWQIASPKTLPQLSAVAYYYGKMLRDSLKIPIGLVINAVGGSPIEAWIDRETLQDSLPQVLTDRFRGNHFTMPWVTERMNKNITNSEDKRQLHPYCPTYLFDTAIRSLANYNFSGVVWYQGESNAHNIELHHKLFKSWIYSWRKHFNNALLPFFFVQLPTLNRPSWGAFRNDQRLLAEQLNQVYMAVTLDCGDSTNVHPTNKQPIGRRLALLTLHYLGQNNANFYRFKHILYTGAIPIRATATNNRVEIIWKNSNHLHTIDGKPLMGFELAGDEQVFYPAQATIKNNKVYLQTNHIKLAKWVRYAYPSFNYANLINGAMLPTSTFIMPIDNNVHKKSNN